MTKPTFSDFEQLSAYLDGELPQAERARLEARLGLDAELRSALDDLRRTRTALRRTPRRRAPHNFTLTPKMAGQRPPVPRLVPVFSWASVVAMLAFLFSFGAGMLPRMFPAGASKAPVALAQAPAQDSGAGAATEAPVERNAAVEPTATPAAFLQAVPLATAAPTTEPASLSTPAADQSPQEAATQPSVLKTAGSQAPQSTPMPEDLFATGLTSQPPAPRRSIPWLYAWLALAVLLAGAALITRGWSRRAYRRKLARPPK